MIDNLKIYSTKKNEFENHIKLNQIVDLKQFYEPFTGEIKPYPLKGKKLNLDIAINEKTAFITGSFHKQYNLDNDLGSQNYNDFNYSKIKLTTEQIIETFKIAKSTSITNLELGFNIIINGDPQKYIDDYLLMYDLKAPNRNEKFLGKGDYKEFRKTDYYFKIYNKSKPYKLDKNILRVEIKIIRKRLLELLGVYSLENILEKKVLNNIFELLMQKFEGLTIIDEFNEIDIPPDELERLKNYMNDNYWIRIKQRKTSKQIYTFKKDFRMLQIKYKLNKTKDEIRRKLYSKFNELINDYDCSQKKVA
ncbi:hypothetical protein [Flavobacterium sp. FlaQc-28]|uniref:hypothetical protein n=1 Tax=Flavobacterium sp. FlaQc-28 TaxID=3374178 RepID=UPI003756DE16